VFTGALYGEQLAAAYASMDVFVHPESTRRSVRPCRSDGVRLPVVAPDAAGARPGRPTAPDCCCRERVRETPAQSVEHLLDERPLPLAARRSCWPHVAAVCDQLLALRAVQARAAGAVVAAAA